MANCFSWLMAVAIAARFAIDGGHIRTRTTQLDSEHLVPHCLPPDSGGFMMSCLHLLFC